MLEVKSVSKIYGEGTSRVIALNSVSLQAGKGDFIAIMGPSGSGKSTLLNIIGGLDCPSSWRGHAGRETYRCSARRRTG
jgi:putative ABC transport system ATP-binding protein